MSEFKASMHPPKSASVTSVQTSIQSYVMCMVYQSIQAPTAGTAASKAQRCQRLRALCLVGTFYHAALEYVGQCRQRV